MAPTTELTPSRSTNAVTLGWQDLVWPQYSALALPGAHLEADFRHYWERLSHPIAVLTSLLLLLRYLSLAQSCRQLFRMPAAICTLRAGVCLAAAGLHGYYQFLFWRPGRKRVRCAPERGKAMAAVGEIVACLLIAMLAEDFNESVSADPAVAYAYTGWGILLLQVTMLSCYHLHALSLLSYVLVEMNAAVNMAPGNGFRGGVFGVTWRFMLCTLCPYLASVACEVCLRRAFLRRYQAMQVELKGSASTSAPQVSSLATPGVAPLAEKASEAARGAVTRRHACQMVKLACGCLGTCTCAVVA